MAHIHIPHDIPIRYLERSKTAQSISIGMFVVGLATFIYMLTQNPKTAWISYTSNWLFFTSIALGGIMLVVITTLVSARWNWSVRRIGISFSAWLPIAFLFFLPMLGLRENYFPWIAEMAEDPILQHKQAWLNVPFLVTRQLVGVLILFGVALYFSYLELRPDMGLARSAGSDDPGRARWRERLTSSWLGQEQEEVHSHRRMAKMAPATLLIYAVIVSFIAFDWIMSLEPHWYSTLFGAWFFMGGTWGGTAATAVASMWLIGQHTDFELAIGRRQRHDLGMLAFGFTVFWAYQFWSHYIVIWYGKLPWEQAWIIDRAAPPWGKLSATVIVLCFVLPFILLVGRAPKLRPPLLGSFASVILLGLWLERYMLLAPSVWEEGDPVFGIWHPLIALMFLGPFLFALRWFWSTFPVLQVWQPMERNESMEAERYPVVQNT